MIGDLSKQEKFSMLRNLVDIEEFCELIAQLSNENNQEMYERLLVCINKEFDARLPFKVMPWNDVDSEEIAELLLIEKQARMEYIHKTKWWNRIWHVVIGKGAKS